MIFDLYTVGLQFLSTPSARRATVRQRAQLLDCGISIHALREEGDSCRVIWVQSLLEFLSTPSARRAWIEIQGETAPK